jgi:hypothetical protein
MGVNASSFVHQLRHSESRGPVSVVVPVLGFLICAFLWVNLSHAAFFVGLVWLTVGIAYGAVRTHGFQSDLVNFDIPADEA